MMNFFELIIFKLFRKKVMNMMGGWKSWVGGIGLIVLGIGQIITGFTNNDFDTVKLGFASVSAGFVALGIAHKIEKTGGQNGKNK